MTNALNGKTVLVTGAGRGIGAAAAIALAGHGAAVAVNYFNNHGAAQKTLDTITSHGGRGTIFQADVRDRADVDRMVQAVREQLGPIDILVNNANIDFPIKPFIELSWTEIETKIAGELQAFYNCSRAVLQDMLLRRSGKIIQVGSVLSRSPGLGFTAHAAAKAAADAMVRNMALELGPSGISVNVLAPGLVLTDATAGLPPEMFKAVESMTPLCRVATPDDIARVLVFLASSQSDYLTGQYIPVNGGSFMG